jgi:hypothetical protein
MPLRSVTCKGKRIVIPDTVGEFVEAMTELKKQLKPLGLELGDDRESRNCATQVQEIFRKEDPALGLDGITYTPSLAALKELDNGDNDTPRSNASTGTDSSTGTDASKSSAFSSASTLVDLANTGSDKYKKSFPKHEQQRPFRVGRVGGKRKTAKKMSKRKLTKWCKSKKNRRSKKCRKICKKMSRKH